MLWLGRRTTIGPTGERSVRLPNVEYRVDHLSVSTVVPTFNRASLLPRALESVVSQCEAGDQVVVVDDGSTDDTEFVVRSFEPAVEYIRTTNGGAGAARNVGIRAARCDLVAFLDADDEWMPGKLAQQRAVLMEFADALFVFSDFAGTTPSGAIHHQKVLGWRHDSHPWAAAVLGAGVSSRSLSRFGETVPAFTVHVGRLYEDLIRHWSVFAGTIVVRRLAAGDALRFPEDVRLYEDLECFARLAGRGLAAYMDCETAWQHYHPGPRLTNADALTRADTALTVIGRVWGRDDVYLASHGREFDEVMDLHRCRKTRALLGLGRPADARRELERCRRAPVGLSMLSRLPAPLLRVLMVTRARLRWLRWRIGRRRVSAQSG